MGFYSPAMTPDRPLFGILLMLGFCLFAPMGDAIAKFLGGTVPLVELLLVRFVAQPILMLPLLWRSRTGLGTSRRVFGLSIVRTLLHIIAIGAMFTSLRFLPMADAIAIAFVMPFILLLLGKTILKEEVGPRRLIAACIGFGGTLLVIQPSFAAVGPPALLPLLVALAFALFMLVTRQIAKEVEPITLQALSGLIATPLLAVLALMGLATNQPDLSLILPSGSQIALLLLLGILGTTAHLLMTWSLRFAPAASLAPMQYLEIPVATLIGWAVFGDLPNGLAAIGILITIAAGLYVIWREHHIARTSPAGSAF